MRQEPVSLTEASRFFTSDTIMAGASALGFRSSGTVAMKDGVALVKDEGQWRLHGSKEAIQKVRRVIAGSESPSPPAES
ncbi:MAG: hypothetical protein A3I39_00150 [Candidatus Yanofskybacteria bacterium RIFCSPLOWO2_02_FULL_47_9b]|uniref:Uncharacterized protein n=1 Tax=Candidatus Yanofskybacteria bacterium RIFCSPLOWO2_02_FULL_47_9b TaxID=1802708 RepID=A0A1F8HB05_9BACT|nr:MAG: hypothetical protein A3I39_00150 [Candidatus Yanofskybacteria bacterium RIFCSPLOWO2_02_FULL_47_9b]